MNIARLPTPELLDRTRHLVQEELRIGLEVLTHLREIERRRLYLELGHSSLFVFCLRELGYSESQAQLRIDAMRAIRETPEIEAKLRTGELNVTAVVKVQRFLRQEKKMRAKNYSLSDRAKLFSETSGKSVREVEQALVALSPSSAVPTEKAQLVTNELMELRMAVSRQAYERLLRLQQLHSHRLKNPQSLSELVELIAEDATRSADKKLNGTNPKPDQTIAPISIKVRSRRIPASVRREVWRRDQGRCSFRSDDDKRRCDSRSYLQIDHVTPFSQGGRSDQPGNLRLLCGAHNRLAWRRTAKLAERAAPPGF